MKITKTSTETKGKNYEVIEDFGSLGERAGGWEVKLRLVKWGDHAEKYDIRPWRIDEDGNETAGKGLTLSGDELEKLGKIITE